MKLEPNIERQLAALAEDEGLELLATEIVGAGSKTIVRLVVDGPEGVTLDQCASVSRQASALLDVEDPIRHSYTLEVTSPGLERKLFSRTDYERFRGRRIRVKLQPSCRQHRTVFGRLDDLEGELLRVQTDSGETVELDFGDVLEARLEVDWDSVLKEGKRRA